MDKSKPTETQPSHDVLVERLEALENRLEKLQDYTVLNIRDLYESDLDQKRAILNTQHVMLGDLKQRGIWNEPEEPKEYQAPSLEESIQRMQNLRNKTSSGSEDQEQGSAGSTSAGSQLLISMKR